MLPNQFRWWLLVIALGLLVLGVSGGIVELAHDLQLANKQGPPPDARSADPTLIAAAWRGFTFHMVTILAAVGALLIAFEALYSRRFARVIEAQAQFRSVLDHSPAVVYVKDLNRRYLFVNRRCGELSGVPPERWLHRHASEIVGPQFATQFEANDLRIIETHRSHEVMESFEAPDGSRIHLLSLQFPILDESGKLQAIAGISTDVTARINAERALARQAHILDQLHDAIITTDLNGIIRSSNAAVERTYGYLPEQLIGQSVSVLYFPDDLGLMQSQVIAPLMEKGHHETELRNRHATGREIFIHLSLGLTYDDSGAPNGMIGYSIDITDRYLAEREKRRLAEVIEQVHDAVITTDLEGTIRSANAAAERIYGYKPDQLIGRSASILYFPEDAHRLHDDVIQPLHDKGRHDIEIRKRHSSGREIYVHMSLSLMLDELGKARGVIGYSIDITDRYLAQKQLAERDATLRAFFDHAPIGLGVLELMPDGHDLRFRSANPACQCYSGLPPEGLIGSLFSESISHSKARLWAKHARRSLETGCVSRFEYLSNTTGEPRWLAVQSSPMPRIGDEPPLACFSVQDRTTEHRALQALRESEARFRSMADTAPVLIWLAGPDGRCTYFNRTWLDYTGRTEDQELNEGWAQGVDPEDRESAVSTYEEAFHARRPFEMEYRLRRHDGQYRWLLDRGNPRYTPTGEFLGYIGTCVDIHDRINAQNDLRKSEASLRAVVDSMPSPVFQRDTNGVCILQNASARRLYGKQIGTRLQESDVPPGILDRWLEQFHSALRGESLIVENEYGEADSKRITEHRIGPVRDGEEILGVVGIELDITERRRMEEALRASEDRFRRAILQAPVPIVLYCEDGQILTLSDEWCKLSGYTVDELRTIEDWLIRAYGEHASPVREAIQTIFDSEERQDNGEFEIRIANGERRFWDFSSSPLVPLPDGRRVMITMARDVTERKRSEEALRASEERFRALAESIPGAVYQLRKRPDGSTYYGYISPRLAEFFAVDLDTLSSTASFAEFVHPDDRPIYLESRSRAVDHETNWRFEGRLVGKDGRTRWCHARSSVSRDGAEVVWNGVILDVTEQHEAEAARFVSERRFEALFQEAADPIFIMDSAKRVAAINRQACVSLGYSADELVGMSIPDFDASITLEEGATLWQRAQDAAGQPLTFETTHRRKDGSIFPVEIRLVAVEWGGEPSNLAIVRDITERKRAEAEIRALNVDLERRVADRTAELTKLVAILDASTDFIYTTTPQARVTWTNHAARRDLFHNAHEGTSLRCLDVYTPESSRLVTQEGLPTADSEGHWMGETEVVTSDGSRRPVSQLILAHRGNDGAVAYYSTIMRDLSDRKRAENALRASEERYRLATNAIRGVVFDIDLVNDTVERSSGLATIIGFDPTEANVASEWWFARIHPDDIEPMKAALERALSAQKPLVALDYRIRHRDGTYRYVWEQTSLVYDHDGKPIRAIGCTIDISDRKNAEEALRASEERYRLATDAFRGVVFDWDPASNHVERSNGLYGMLGYETSPRGESWWFELMHPDDRQRIVDQLEQAVDAHQQTIETEYRVRHINGEYRQVWECASLAYNDSGQLRRVVGCTLDITDRKRAEEALRASEERFRLMAETIQDVFWMTTPSSDQILYVNQAYESIWGRTIESIYANPTSFLDAIHPDDRARVLEAFGDITSPVSAEYRVVHPDGSVRWVLDRGYLVHDERGNPSFLIGTATDVTTRHEAEVALRDRSEQLSYANAQLARASRLKDEFLANMSHELRTPLNGILGLTEALQEGIFGELNFEQIEALRNVEQSGRHLLSLINDILDLSKIEAGQVVLAPEVTSVSSVCQGSLRMVRQVAQKKRQELALKIDPQVDHLVVDERRLRQILVNLLSNAVKFTPDGGTVTLDVQGDRDREIVSFSVIDTGIGIRSEDLGLLFQPFRQIDSRLSRQYEGTGLGLALVARMVELHHGTVRVESEHGAGSRFIVELPWSVPPAAPHSAPSVDDPAQTQLRSTSCGPLPSNAIILLVDDNDSYASIATQFLETHHLHVVRARDGAEAVRLAAEIHPSLIIMDIQMPGMDGLEATRLIRSSETNGHIPIIALTALAMPGDRDRCLEAGLDDYFTKPTRLSELVQLIRQRLSEDSEPPRA